MISGHQRRNRKSTIVTPVENGDEMTADQFTKILYLKYFSGIENMVKQNNVEVRYLNEKNKSEIVNIICGDLTYFIVFKDPLTVIEIKESHIAEHFRNIFMLLWNNANQLKSGNE